MIRRRNNGNDNHRRIPKAYGYIEGFPTPSLPHLALFKCPPENAGVVDHRAADHEGVAEMHGWHSGKGVDVVARHEDRGCIIMTDGVEKAVLGRKEAGRHARIEGKG